MAFTDYLNPFRVTEHLRSSVTPVRIEGEEIGLSDHLQATKESFVRNSNRSFLWGEIGQFALWAMAALFTGGAISATSTTMALTLGAIAVCVAIGGVAAKYASQKIRSQNMFNAEEINAELSARALERTPLTVYVANPERENALPSLPPLPLRESPLIMAGAADHPGTRYPSTITQLASLQEYGRVSPDQERNPTIH